MKDLDTSFDNIREAKKFSMSHKISALQELILQRFQALTTISSISFAVSGIVISVRSDIIKSEALAIFSAILFIAVALISLGRHLWLIREDINGISQKIKSLPTEDWATTKEDKAFKADWWPETLYVVLVIGILLFGVSLLC